MYYSLNDYFKNKYKQKVGKLSLDGGFTCPNRDGTLSSRGCIFCSEKGSGDFTKGNLNLKDQIKFQKEINRKKWDNKKFIGYFQNFTNTYEGVAYLKKLYYEVLEDDEIIGLSIATRADCLSDEVLDLIENLSKNYEIWLEIGMQTINEDTIKYINRGYSHKYLDEKLAELRKRNIKFLLHVIFGLPGESKEEILKSIDYVSSSGAFGIKIHSLYIQSDSRLYKEYLDGKIKLMTKDEYTDLISQALMILNKNIVVHRITGDGDKSKLIAPLWAADKLSVIGEINKKLKLLKEK